MGGVRQNVKAPGIAGVLVAGEPDVAFFCDKADQQGNHRRYAQTVRRKYRQPVFEGVEHPDAVDLPIAGGVEGGGCAQGQGVEEHAVEIPGRQTQGNVSRKFCFIAVKPGTAFLSQFVFQLFQEL